MITLTGVDAGRERGIRADRRTDGRTETDNSRPHSEPEPVGDGSSRLAQARNECGIRSAPQRGNWSLQHVAGQRGSPQTAASVQLNATLTTIELCNRWTARVTPSATTNNFLYVPWHINDNDNPCTQAAGESRRVAADRIPSPYKLRARVRMHKIKTCTSHKSRDR
jgi:hypothetical protein